MSIPYGQRFINIKLAPQAELVNIVPRGANTGTWTASAALGEVDQSVNLVRTMELYINNIFVNPEVHDIFIKRIGFTLIRVHRQQNHGVVSGTTSAEVLLQQLKWPIEALFIGMKVADYNSSTEALRAQHLDKWHTFSQVTKTSRAAAGWTSLQAVNITGTQVDVTVAGVVTVTGGDLDGTVGGTAEVAAGDQLLVNGAAYEILSVTNATTLQLTQNGAAAIVAIVNATSFSALRRVEQTSTVDVCTRTIDQLTIKAHGIPIYNDFPAGFYNAYLPFHYGGSNLNTPDDCGALFVPFCLYPGTYQPSGHINISRAREFYLEFTSSVTGSVAGTLIVVASALNFLLISDGSAVLRYST